MIRRRPFVLVAWMTLLLFPGLFSSVVEASEGPASLAEVASFDARVLRHRRRPDAGHGGHPASD